MVLTIFQQGSLVAAFEDEFEPVSNSTNVSHLWGTNARSSVYFYSFCHKRRFASSQAPSSIVRSVHTNVSLTGSSKVFQSVPGTIPDAGPDEITREADKLPSTSSETDNLRTINSITWAGNQENVVKRKTSREDESREFDEKKERKRPGKNEVESRHMK